MSDLQIHNDTVLTFDLPGLIAIRIDTTTRTIAIDGISGRPADGEPLAPEWRVLDLRDGISGDFHRLRPESECVDVGCIQAGEHDISREVWAPLPPEVCGLVLWVDERDTGTTCALLADHAGQCAPEAEVTA